MGKNKFSISSLRAILRRCHGKRRCVSCLSLIQKDLHVYWYKTCTYRDCCASQVVLRDATRPVTIPLVPIIASLLRAIKSV